jgi:riboflavin kinase/FMN adenylyltransferase
VELIRDYERIDARFRGGVLSVGVFDGVHLGHRKVLGRAVERARDLGARSVVFTFHPHPLEVLRPEEAPPLIQTFGKKLELMRQMGLDAVVWPERMEEVLRLAPEEFVNRVVCEALAARVVVEGRDFRFGAGAGGDLAKLSEIACDCKLQVESVGDVLVGGERVSSTRIRRLIQAGKVAEAARCLGRPYAYVGTVVEGHHRGARLGYPTVNLSAPRFLVPAEGVYAGWAEVRGERVGAAISVGRAPTFDATQPPTVEAFLLDFDGELYGEQVAVEFLRYLRPQETFADADALRQKMADDCARVRELLARAAAAATDRPADAGDSS